MRLTKSGQDTKKATPVNMQNSRTAAPSIISNDVVIEGNVQSASEIHLEGQVKGNITCDTLVMGEQGTITGDVMAGTVTVRGTVNGDIKARVVQLEKNATINGDVTHESLTVEAGARLNGRFTHSSAAKAESESGRQEPKLGAGKSIAAE